MRVVELSTFHEACGIATYTESLVAALEQVGIAAEVLAPLREPGAVATGPSPPRLWSRDRATLREALRTVRHLRKLRPDVVHLQINYALFSPRFVWGLALGCALGRIPIVATVHGRFGGGWRRSGKLVRMLVPLARADLVVHNEAHRAELPWGRRHVIPHGIGLAGEGELREAKQAIGANPDRPVLAHVGFLHSHKGVAETLEALATLRQRGHTDVCFWVCGAAAPTGESRRHLEQLRQRTAELGLTEQVSIPGEFVADDELLAKLRAADWLLLNYCCF